MRGLRNCMLALLAGLLAPLLIWAGAGVALHQSRQRSGLLKRALHDLACSIDTDCPAGYMCVSGHCVPAK